MNSSDITENTRAGLTPGAAHAGVPVPEVKKAKIGVHPSVALGRRLADIRTERRLRQTQVAARMHLTKGRISHIEVGHVSTLQVIARYAEALGGHLLQTIWFDESTVCWLPSTDGATLGRQLQEIRTTCRLTQADVAARMHLTKTRVSHIENGRIAHREVVTCYAEALGGHFLQAIWFDDATFHWLPNDQPRAPGERVHHAMPTLALHPSRHRPPLGTDTS